MSEEKPKTSPPVVHYASPDLADTRTTLVLRKASFHFSIGLGVATLVAATIILRGRPSDYPVTLGCGGIGVILIQLMIFLLPAWGRFLLFRRRLEERSVASVVICGALSACLVFLIPAVLHRMGVADGPLNVVTLALLVLGPSLSSFFSLTNV